ncbi:MULTISPECIES: AraC family transcriptional regulator [Paenibacillus]|uniref:AraC-like protein n=1 Tax=Paenibacillus pabuli TaxID=1472 RepID=A0A855Y2W6_9BACL|nr:MULTISPECIES: AraC family transcriptional regulator [Paenibacillus]PWW34393.1 AraC-like protein [Paenibacillus pabuli]PXW00814.1 AraC-like protein [Paenibacillus taichungensis]RAI98238.1 AraC-like protein [Paenibacillus pabuli]
MNTDHIRKREGFVEEKLYVLPEYWMQELEQEELTSTLFITDIGYFPNALYHFRERLEGSPSYIFIFCEAGEGWVELNHGERMMIQQGNMMIIPPETAHRYGAMQKNPWSIYWFHFKGIHAERLVKMFGLSNASLSLSPSGKARLMEWFVPTYEMLTERTYALTTHVHVAQTTRQMLSGIGLNAVKSAQEKKRESYLEQAIQYMHVHMSDSISLTELAKHVGVSKQHLIFLFNSETGVAPIEYFLRLKIQRAGHLLDLTELNIKEVSYAVGISDPYYFSRLFKKISGYSPSSYRKIPKG